MNMKAILSSIIFYFSILAVVAQPRAPQIDGKEVFKNDDVVFHQLDDHTWIGSGHVMASESLYLLEGNDKALLIDAGTKIADLDKVVASITKKPVMLVATHVHPDHVGSTATSPRFISTLGIRLLFHE
jgi:hydroxyacylglutathione hydrolase